MKMKSLFLIAFLILFINGFSQTAEYGNLQRNLAMRNTYQKVVI